MRRQIAPVPSNAPIGASGQAWANNAAAKQRSRAKGAMKSPIVIAEATLNASAANARLQVNKEGQPARGRLVSTLTRRCLTNRA